MKGEGRRRTQLLDDLRNRRRYWELKEEAEDRNRWKDSLSIEHKEGIVNTIIMDVFNSIFSTSSDNKQHTN